MEITNQCESNSDPKMGGSEAPSGVNYPAGRDIRRTVNETANQTPIPGGAGGHTGLNYIREEEGEEEVAVTDTPLGGEEEQRDQDGNPVDHPALRKGLGDIERMLDVAGVPTKGSTVLVMDRTMVKAKKGLVARFKCLLTGRRTGTKVKASEPQNPEQTQPHSSGSSTPVMAPLSRAVSEGRIMPTETSPHNVGKELFDFCVQGERYNPSLFGEFARRASWNHDDIILAQAKLEKYVLELEQKTARKERLERSRQQAEDREEGEKGEVVFLYVRGCRISTEVKNIMEAPVPMIRPGKVQDAVDAIWDKVCENPSLLDYRSTHIRRIRWGVLNAVTDIPTSIINRRVLDPVEESFSGAYRETEKGDKVVTNPRGSWEVTSQGRFITKEKKVRKESMTARARDVAEKIRGDPHRIRGFFALAHQNQKWAGAVARCLAKKKFGTVSHEDKDVLGPEKAQQMGRATMDLVTVWACKDVGSMYEEKGHVEIDDLAVPEDTPVRGDYNDIVVRALCSSGLTSAIHQCESCVFCVMSELDIPFSLNEGKFCGHSLDQLRELNLNRLLKTNSRGYLEAMAAIHNREQHSLNGNIQFTVKGDTPRNLTSSAAMGEAWSVPPIRSHQETDTAMLNTDLDNRMSKVNYYSENYQQAMVYGENGTVHQFVSDSTRFGTVEYTTARRTEVYATLEAMYNADYLAMGAELAGIEEELQRLPITAENLERIASLSSRRTILNSERATAQARYTQSAREEFERLCRREAIFSDTSISTLESLEGMTEATYIGVGCDRKLEHGYLTPTNVGAQIIVDANNTEMKGVGINDARGYNIARFACGANVTLSALAKNGTSERTDIRDITLRSMLYDSMRQKVITQPTGQCYALAKKEAIITRHIIDKPSFKAVVVSTRYVDSCLRSGSDILVTSNGTTSKWSLVAEDTVVVALDDCTSDNNLAWAAWCVCHLPLGDVRVYDEFTIRRMGSTTTKKQVFLRNASAVIMGTEIKRIVFLVADENRKQIQLEGQERVVAKANRYGDITDLAVPFDATQTVHDMRERVITSATSTAIVINEYLSRYVTTIPNWGEIHMLTSVLISRFPRLPECTRTLAATSVRHLPTEVRIAYMTGSPNMTYTYEDTTSVYDHQAAVSAFNHVFASRSIAGANPALKIGKWSNMAELGLFTGMLLYNPTNTESEECVNTGLNGTNLDAIDRAALVRRGTEEWMAATGLREAITAPSTFVEYRDIIDRAFSGSSEIVTLSSVASNAIGGETTRWLWSVNYVSGSLTGTTSSRLHSNMYRTSYNREFVAIDITSRDYKLDNIQESATYNKIVQVGVGKDDSIVENVALRIDYLRTDEWGYKDWPNLTALRYGSCRLQTTASADLAKSAGWTGFYRGEEITWGWGAYQRLKDLAQNKYRTITFGVSLNSQLLSNLTTRCIWYANGPESPMPITVTNSYLRKEEGFCAKASLLDSGGVRKGVPENIDPAKVATAEPGITSLRDGTLEEHKKKMAEVVIQPGNPERPDSLVNYVKKDSSEPSTSKTAEKTTKTASSKTEQKQEKVATDKTANRVVQPRPTAAIGTTEQEAARSADHRAPTDPA
nr:MAG: coat protein [Totiviridae sp. 2]